MVVDVSEAAEIFTSVVKGLGLAVVADDDHIRPDLIPISAGGERILVQLHPVSAATPTQVSHLASDRGQLIQPNALHVLVADRIAATTRAELTHRGWGWLDLRGHLHLVARGLFVDTAVPSVRAEVERTDPFAGPAGVEVACALLLTPNARQGVRALARSLGRSPSTVSEVLGVFRKHRLVTPEGNAVIPSLFWETAGAWRPHAAQLADRPRLGLDLPGNGPGSVDAALQLGFDDVESQPGWALTGTLAAAAYGAPVAVRSDYPPDFYVPNPAILRRAARLLGEAVNAEHRRASVRVAPVRAICEERIDPAGQRAQTWSSTSEYWPLALPLFVALDLASDPGRGREILDGWHPPQPWQRVW